MKKYLVNVSFIAILLWLFCQNAQAEFDLNKNDNEKVYISSESADLNRSSGVGIYRTNVSIDQGTTHVKGHVITTHTDANNKLKEAIIEGSAKAQAHYETEVEKGKPILYAKANTIKYYPQKNYIILIGNASITQGTDSIKGERLEYDISQQHLIAKGKSTGSERTTIVIIPKNDNSGSLINKNAVKK